jgi:Arc/MetJ-type ribon-helix-helix transcriptional regulator
MTIHLPPDIESSIQAAVHRGHFASVDDAMKKAASMLLQELKQESAMTSSLSNGDAVTSHKPIWEEILELTADIPDEEFAKLPVDGAEQHDHYIYGIPKRPQAP